MRQLGRSTVAVLVSAVFAAVATLVPAGPASASGYPWTVVPTPNSAGALETSLADTSCTPGGFCMAVGATNHGRVDQAFSEYMQDSPWAVVNTPSSSPNRANDLYGVSCVSASFCVAVGVAATSGIGQTLIEQWDGSTWKLLPSPDTNPGEAQQLQAVSCTSVTSCQAVGSVDEVAGTTDTLVESWNGATWSIVGSPDEGTGGLSELDGVSCPASTECTAVGSYFNGSVEPDPGRVLERHGPGRSCRAPIRRSGTTSVLTSASCPLPTACTAVGYSAPGSTFQTLVEGVERCGVGGRAEPRHRAHRLRCAPVRLLRLADLVLGGGLVHAGRLDVLQPHRTVGRRGVDGHHRPARTRPAVVNCTGCGASRGERARLWGTHRARRRSSPRD